MPEPARLCAYCCCCCCCCSHFCCCCWSFRGNFNQIMLQGKRNSSCYSSSWAWGFELLSTRLGLGLGSASGSVPGVRHFSFENVCQNICRGYCASNGLHRGEAALYGQRGHINFNYFLAHFWREFCISHDTARHEMTRASDLVSGLRSPFAIRRAWVWCVFRGFSARLKIFVPGKNTALCRAGWVSQARTNSWLESCYVWIEPMPLLGTSFFSFLLFVSQSSINICAKQSNNWQQISLWSFAAQPKSCPTFCQKSQKVGANAAAAAAAVFNCANCTIVDFFYFLLKVPFVHWDIKMSFEVALCGGLFGYLHIAMPGNCCHLW